ncbi:MAG: hypothetical protein KDC46_16575, partial [Thermoleophilia bacterium]|nr:hypothetical protein [Thermoleophilia bacterium]
LPLQLRDAQPAHQTIPYLVFDEYTPGTRYAAAWRAILAGERADPHAFAAAIDQLETAADPATTQHAIDQLLLHGSDLPGANDALLGHPLASSRDSLVQQLLSRRSTDPAIGRPAAAKLAEPLRQRLHAISLTPDHARTEAAALAAAGGSDALITALYDHGLGIPLDLPPIPRSSDRSAYVSYSHRLGIRESTWRSAIDHRIAATTPGQAIEQLLALGGSSEPFSTDTAGELLGLLHVLPRSDAAIPADPGRLAAVRRLADRAAATSSTRELDDMLTRIQLQLRDLRTPLPDPAPARARVLDALIADWNDPVAARRAQSTLIDSGLLERMLPSPVSGPVIDRLERASRSTAAGYDARAAALRALYALDPTPTGAIAEHLHALFGADNLPFAVVDTLFDTYRSDMAPREIARILSTATVDDPISARHVATRARSLLASAEVTLPAPLRTQLEQSLQRYDDSVAGIAYVGYEGHPDYQDIGRMQSVLGLAVRLAERPAAPASPQVAPEL